MSAKADTVPGMNKPVTPPLLAEIDAFLAETGMGPSYFGRAAVGNSELVARLKDGRRVWPETEEKARAFIADKRRERRQEKAEARP